MCQQASFGHLGRDKSFSHSFFLLNLYFLPNRPKANTDNAASKKVVATADAAVGGND
jgi:hypothetical protein